MFFDKLSMAFYRSSLRALGAELEEGGGREGGSQLPLQHGTLDGRGRLSAA